ncbi:MAG: prepilin-type N-terminal cleavage/methylation domain-containing protein [Planctomycetes bacterium]|nr:prepilin-type N-terminal cleavage/methylation domain-containing protein [Planctomycetota bacterium]
MKNYAFTLIEILVSMTIFMSILALVGNVFYRTNKVTRQSLSVLELFQRAEGVNRLLVADFEYIMQTCALHIDTDEDIKTITFMSSMLHDPVKDGDGHSFEKKRHHAAQWIRWHWDNTTGTIKRARSRPTDWSFSQDLRRDQLSRELHKNNVKPTPQQHYVYFEGDSKIAEASDFRNPRRTKHQVCEGSVMPAYGSPDYYNDIDMRFRHEYSNYYLATLPLVGDNTAKVSNGVYAVRNPDGLSYNKDKAYLVGADNNTHYPSQLADVTIRIEMFSVELLKRDAVTAITVADDDDTISDDDDSIDISGLNLNVRSDPQYAKRPQFANIAYLLHDVPGDVYADNSNEFLIDALRNQVLADSSLDDVDVNVQTGKRRQALYDLIEENGYNAVVVFRSIKMPL